MMKLIIALIAASLIIIYLAIREAAIECDEMSRVD